MTITILHNPDCSKSRRCLQILLNSGIQPNIIEYLQTPPTYGELKNIITQLNMTPRDMIRTNEEPYSRLNLGAKTLSDEQLIAAMVDNPILIQRPIILAHGMAVIGRPPESIFDLV